MTDDAWDAMIGINLTGPMVVTREIVPLMKKAQRGVIVNNSSVMGLRGGNRLSHYVASKHGLTGLTKAWAIELAPHGIRVVGLRPQAMPETDTIREAFEPRAAASGLTWEEWQELLASRNHARRLMAPEEMADMAVVLASDRARGLTGTIVNLTMGSLDD